MTPLQIAILELGKQEIPRGSNWGEHVRKYLASVGIHFPASWCMAFVYWCVETSGFRIDVGGRGQSILVNPLVKTGGVLRQWNEIDTQYGRRDFRKETPAAGDIFIMDFGHGLGHTGFVESVEGDTIHTIEGNTNDTGSREGYEVCRRYRKISVCKGFIHLT